MKVEMKMKRNRRNRGQGMTEYIIIVALIAIAAIAVVTLFGDNIRRLFATSTSGALAGNDAVTPAPAAIARPAIPTLARHVNNCFYPRTY